MKLDVVPIPSPGRAATRVRRRQGGPRKLVVGLSVDVTTVLLCTQGRPSTNSRRWFCRADCDVHCHAAGQARLPGPKLTQGMANVRPEAAVESSPPRIGPLLPWLLQGQDRRPVPRPWGWEKIQPGGPLAADLVVAAGMMTRP